MKELTEADSMLNKLISIAEAEAAGAKAEAAGAKAEAAGAKAEAAKAKAKLLKQLTDWYGPLVKKGRPYYIHQSHGMIWNQQQPFGGFSLEGVIPDYLDRVKPHGNETELMDVKHTVLVPLIGNHIKPYRDDNQVTPLKEQFNMSIYGVHLLIRVIIENF